MNTALLFCVVIYDGSNQPEHLQKVYRFKGIAFETGKETECTDVLAGHLLATAPTGSVRLVSGEPKPWTPITGAQKAAIASAAKRARDFFVDPARALEGLLPLSAATLKLSAAEVEAGKADSELGAFAIWAQLGGKTDLAKAAVRRSGAIRPKA